MPLFVLEAQLQVVTSSGYKTCHEPYYAPAGAVKSTMLALVVTWSASQVSPLP